MPYLFDRYESRQLCRQTHTDPETELTGDGELELRTEHVPARDVGHRRVQSAELLLHTHLQRATVQQRLLQRQYVTDDEENTNTCDNLKRT